MEVTNSFKRLDQIDRVLEVLWIEIRDIVHEAVIRAIPKGGGECKKTTWLSEDALQIVEGRREVKGKEKKEDISI